MFLVSVFLLLGFCEVSFSVVRRCRFAEALQEPKRISGSFILGVRLRQQEELIRFHELVLSLRVLLAWINTRQATEQSLRLFVRGRQCLP